MTIPEGPTPAASPATGRARVVPTAAVAVVVVVVVVAGYSWWAANTRPFTVAADTATSVGLVGLVVVTVIRLVSRRRETSRGVDAGGGRSAEVAGDVDSAAAPTAASPALMGPAGGKSFRPARLPWLLALAALLIIELTTYFAGWSGGRHQYPTLSSLYDTAARFKVVKTLVVAAWLAFGLRVLGRR